MNPYAFAIAGGMLLATTSYASSPEHSTSTDGPSIPVSALHVGDGTANCRILSDYENAWRWTVTTPDGKKKIEGTWSDRLDRVTADGQAVFRRVQGMTYVTAMTFVSVTRFDPVTCAPITSEQHNVDGTINRHTVTGTHVVSERTASNGQKTTTPVDLAMAPFDFFNGQDGLLLAALPLKVGYSGTVFAIDEIGQKDGLKLAPFKVVREETVAAGAHGKVDTFVVVADLPGEYTQTFWISQKPPYFIRLVVDYPDNRYSFSFDMI